MTPVRPDNFLGIDAAVWSNYDCIMNEPVAKHLESGDCYALHAAWDYAGYIWFDTEAQTWHEEIRQYGNTVDMISGDSVTNVIAKTLAKHGVA